MKKLVGLIALFMVATTVVQAQKTSVFIKNNAAIDGYDVVAFFKENNAVKGNQNLSYVWNDATWYFSSTQNVDSFKANPEKYAPQYGGYCAYGCSNGYKAPTQIDTWTIVDNKLYFNYNLKVKNSWITNKEALIEKANINWEKIKHTP